DFHVTGVQTCALPISSVEELYKPYYWIVGGEKEEILQRETPTQRYVSAQLFPIDIQDPVVLETEIIDNEVLEDNLALEELFNLRSEERRVGKRVDRGC